MAESKICLILETSISPDSIQTNNCLLVQFCQLLLRNHLLLTIRPLFSCYIHYRFKSFAYYTLVKMIRMSQNATVVKYPQLKSHHQVPSRKIIHNLLYLGETSSPIIRSLQCITSTFCCTMRSTSEIYP